MLDYYPFKIFFSYLFVINISIYRSQWNFFLVTAILQCTDRHFCTFWWHYNGNAVTLHSVASKQV